MSLLVDTTLYNKVMFQKTMHNLLDFSFRLSFFIDFFLFFLIYYTLEPILFLASLFSLECFVSQFQPFMFFFVLGITSLFKGHFIVHFSFPLRLHCLSYELCIVFFSFWMSFCSFYSYYIYYLSSYLECYFISQFKRSTCVVYFDNIFFLENYMDSLHS